MGKQDRSVEQKKESAKARKKAVAGERKEQKDAQQAAQDADHEESTPADSQPAPAAGRRGQSAFARAALVAEDDEDEAPAAQAPRGAATSEPPAERGRKENATARKKQQPKRGSDMEDLLVESRDAQRQRVLQRFLRLILVGLVLETWRDRSTAREAKETKGKKKGPTSGGRSGTSSETTWSIRSVFRKVDLFGGPFLMLAFTVAMLAARLFEEGYTPDSRRENEANYYEVLGLSSDADIMDVRKAYKALALSWHPDKNPGCEACATRFSRISDAYETLSNPEYKKAYDQRKARKGSLDTMASTDLTAEDFEQRVSRSNEVWIIQVFDPNEGLSQHFHPVWEDVAHSHQHVAKFGRIDATKQRRAMDFLPQRVVLTPLVFRFARGLPHDTFLWSGGEDQNGGAFSRFIADGYPTVHRFEGTSELMRWWTSDRPLVLVVGPPIVPRRGAKGLELLQVQRVAHMWAEFIDFASCDVKIAREVLGQELQVKEGASWTFVSKAGSATKSIALHDLKDAPSVLQEIIEDTLRSLVPSVTVRNHQQLCGASGFEQVVRTFCLVCVDMSDHGAIAGLLADLNVSRSTYAQEVSESDLGEDAEEPFRIQPVRIMRGNSRLPWQPAAAGTGFYPLWNEAGRAAAFVVEVETGRIAPTKTANIKDLYQQIAYEDLKFKELPEGAPLVRALPDPENPFRRELLLVLSSPISALALFLLLAGVAAVLPEVQFITACISVAVAAAVFLISSPWALRRCIAFLWCTVSPSSFECQANI